MESHDTYERLIALLDERYIPYRLIDHPPEGRTEIVSAMRGNALAAAAKCIVLMVKLGKKVTRYVLAVVPGDMRVDLAAVKTLLGGTYVAFASSEVAERLAGSVAGTILPFSFTPELELIADRPARKRCAVLQRRAPRSFHYPRHPRLPGRGRSSPGPHRHRPLRSVQCRSLIRGGTQCNAKA